MAKVGNAHTGFGAVLQRGNGESPEEFVDVSGIKSISGPSMTRDTHDVTDNQSESNFREFIGGLVNGGEFSFSGNFLPKDPTQNQDAGGLMAEFEKTSCDSKRNWRMVLPACDGAPEGQFDFGGILTNFSVDLPMDDVMSFQATLKVSGKPTLTYVTG
jgi:predicted secreted protein